MFWTKVLVFLLLNGFCLAFFYAFKNCENLKVFRQICDTLRCAVFSAMGADDCVTLR